MYSAEGNWQSTEECRQAIARTATHEAAAAHWRQRIVLLLPADQRGDQFVAVLCWPAAFSRFNTRRTSRMLPAAAAAASFPIRGKSAECSESSVQPDAKSLSLSLVQNENSFPLLSSSLFTFTLSSALFSSIVLSVVRDRAKS